MKRFTQSGGYVRVRAFTGALFVAFGAAIIVRTFLGGRFDGRLVPALVMGAALVALGLLRLRDYLRLRGRNA